MFGRLDLGMKVFEPNSDACNRNSRSSSQVPTLGIRNGGVRAKFGRLQSGTEEFEASSDAWNRE